MAVDSTWDCDRLVGVAPRVPVEGDASAAVRISSTKLRHSFEFVTIVRTNWWFVLDD